MEPIEASPGPWGFIMSFWTRWVVLMTGIVALVAWTFSAFFPDTKPSLVWALAALSAVIFGSYLVWSDERKKVVALQRRFLPSFKLDCSNTEACRIKTEFDQPGDGELYKQKAIFFLIGIKSARDETLTGCYGKLVQIVRKGDGLKIDHGSIRLPFAQNELPDAYAKTIHRGRTEYLDVMVAFENNWATLPLKDKGYKLPASYLENGFSFKPDEHYFLTIDIVGQNAEQPLRVDAVFCYTGNWQTSFLEITPTIAP